MKRIECSECGTLVPSDAGVQVGGRHWRWGSQPWWAAYIHGGRPSHMRQCGPVAEVSVDPHHAAIEHLVGEHIPVGGRP